MSSSVDTAKQVLAANEAVLYGIFGAIGTSGYFPSQRFLNEFLMRGNDPCDQDRRMAGWQPFAVSPEEYREIVETQADSNSYGFRRQRSCADALVQCHRLLCHPYSPCYVLEGDIKACFDQIAHAWLLTHAPMDRLVLRQWLKADYLDKNVFFATTEGTPQGGIASLALANRTLVGSEGVKASL